MSLVIAPIRVFSPLRQPVVKSAYRHITCTCQHYQLENPQKEQQLRDPVVHPSQKVSKSTLIFREKVKSHEFFMRNQMAQYDIGKRHLANMMGEDPDNFTQMDIDRSINYLFPCGIFDKKARPTMKHPSEVFPKQEEAKFDLYGRPHHYLFYTMRPYLYEVFHNVSEKLEKLDAMENRMLSKGQSLDLSKTLVLLGSEWLTAEQLGFKLMEKIWPRQYEHFIRAMTRLAIHPLAFHEREFIFEYRRSLNVRTSTMKIPELVFDENDRPYMEAEGYRKNCRAVVRVTGRGSGHFTVNGIRAISFFLIPRVRTGLIEMRQLMLPLQMVGMLDTVDVSAEVKFEGVRHEIASVSPSAHAGAIRLALSRALRSFADENTVETMRLAGLLHEDPRSRERKKTGMLGARRARTWKKR